MKVPIKVVTAALLVSAVGGCSLGTSNDVRSATRSNKDTTSVSEPTDAPSSATTGDPAKTTKKVATTTTAAPTGPALARASEFVGGNVDPAFGPGEAGKLSVVAVATPNGEEDSIAFVVRNNTSATIYDVSATGKVTSNGQIVGSGESQSVEPASVAPGEIAFGYVYFSTTPPVGSTVEIAATADSEQDSFFTSVPMIIGEANLIPGDFGDEVVGEVTAPADIEVSGSVGVLIFCVDAAGNLTGTGSGYTDGQASILPGASATYSASIYTKTCPTFLIGASGYKAG